MRPFVWWLRTTRGLEKVKIFTLFAVQTFVPETYQTVEHVHVWESSSHLDELVFGWLPLFNLQGKV
jgi:hypothetical protein